ncbi:MAG: hypothetical protein ABIX28_07035 [Vicinamibacterales bacterium]
MLLLAAGIASSVTVTSARPGAGVTAVTDPVPACTVKSITKSAIQGLKVYSPDAAKYLLNKEDANGVAQVYVANADNSNLTCITCVARPGGPVAERLKMQPNWHPSGKWIFMAVERDTYNTPPILGGFRDYVEGQLQSGLWTNMWAVTPDGQQWYRLTDFTGATGTPDGYTGPAFTPDGKKAVWSQIMDGNILVYTPFGRWELTVADIDVSSGAPRLANPKNITPAGMSWNEPGSFRDNDTMVLTGSVERDASGQDQYTLNIKTGQLVNLTNTPTVWDEHGLYSPGGDKIIFMSAYPYRADPNSSKILSIKTEFMMINSDGTNLTQLTHFLTPGYPEYSATNNGIAAVGVWHPDGRGIVLRRLRFPDYEDWDLQFEGRCSYRPAAPTRVRILSP